MYEEVLAYDDIFGSDPLGDLRQADKDPALLQEGWIESDLHQFRRGKELIDAVRNLSWSKEHDPKPYQRILLQMLLYLPEKESVNEELILSAFTCGDMDLVVDGLKEVLPHVLKKMRNLFQDAVETYNRWASWKGCSQYPNNPTPYTNMKRF